MILKNVGRLAALGMLLSGIRLANASVRTQPEATLQDTAHQAEEAMNLGVAAAEQGHFREALVSYQKALALSFAAESRPHLKNRCSLLAAGTNDRSHFPVMGTSQGSSLQTPGLMDFKGEQPTIPEAQQVDEMGSRQLPFRAALYLKLSSAYFAQRDFDSALDVLNRALAIRLATVGEQHPFTAAVYNSLGVVFRPKGDFVQAVEYLERALAIYCSTVGESHPDTAGARMNLGLVFMQQGEFSRAFKELNKALEIFVATGGETQPSVAAVYFNLGALYSQTGELDRAMECYRKALAIRLATVGANHPFTKIVRSELRKTCALLGDSSCSE